MLLSDYSSLLYECGLNPNLIEFYPQEEITRDGLSRRDIAFCYLLSRGVPKDESFKIAYTSKHGPQALREYTLRRLKHPPILAEIKRLIDTDMTPAPTHDPLWLQRTVIKDMLGIINDSKAGPLARIKAGEIILRHIGMTINELVKATTSRAETTQGIVEDLERILKENTGGPITRASLTNGKDDLTLD